MRILRCSHGQVGIEQPAQCSTLLRLCICRDAGKAGHRGCLPRSMASPCSAGCSLGVTSHDERNLPACIQESALVNGILTVAASHATRTECWPRGTGCALDGLGQSGAANLVGQAHEGLSSPRVQLHVLVLVLLLYVAQRPAQVDGPAPAACRS